MQHNPTQDYEYFFKLLVAGDRGSGKTWFMKRLVDEELIPYDVNQPQPSLDFQIKTIIEPETNKVIKLQIWKHKEERFRTIDATNSFRGAHGVIVTVDLTSRDSFNNLKDYFLKIDRYACENVKVLVIGTKSDDTEHRCVWTEQILELVENQKQEEDWKVHELQYIETSAKNNYNVSHALQTIVRSILMGLTDSEIEAQKIRITRNKNNNNSEKRRCIVM